MQRTVSANSTSFVVSLSAALSLVGGTLFNQPILTITGVSSGAAIAIVKLKKITQNQEDLAKQILELNATNTSALTKVIQNQEDLAKQVLQLKVANTSLKTGLETMQKSQKKQQQRIQTQDSRQRLHVQAIQKLQHQHKNVLVRTTNLEQKAVASEAKSKVVFLPQNNLTQGVSTPAKLSVAKVEASPLTRVYIDGANLFNASQELEIKIDFKTLRTFLSEKAARIKFKFYLGVSPQSHKQSFIACLEELKYEVFQLPLLVRDNGNLKIVGDDVQMALDMANDVKSGDRVILVTGDGDLIPAVRQVKERLGVHVTVVAKSSMLNGELNKIADEIILLDDIKYEIAYHEPIKRVK
jgi:uncharacterized LabA/DUF88 family protein